MQMSMRVKENLASGYVPLRRMKGERNICVRKHKELESTMSTEQKFQSQIMSKLEEPLKPIYSEISKLNSRNSGFLFLP